MNWSLQTVYLCCFGIGLGVLVIQIVLLLVGGGDHDASPGDHDLSHAGHDTGMGLSLLSVRTIAGFLAAFGLVGWGGTKAGWNSFATLGAGFLTGSLMLLFTAFVFSNVKRLSAQGNLDPRNAVGKTARVYLRIPGANAGKGKITLSIQGRTSEYIASTAGAEIDTGNEVRVVRQISEDTFEVEAL